ncbi:MAG: OsmC family protein [Steroidobacteraceae bacterium]
MLEYRVSARRIDAHGSLALCKEAQITLDTDVAGRPDAFNPAELLLAALAVCMIKGIERVTPLLKFRLRGAEVRLHAERQDSPPKLVSVDYELTIDTDESDHRLELLHTNIRKFGTVSNTLAAATSLQGRIVRGRVADEAMACEVAAQV